MYMNEYGFYHELGVILPILSEYMKGRGVQTPVAWPSQH